MSSLDRVDRKLRRLRAIEASYRHAMKRSEDEARHETVDREKAMERLEKIRARYSRRIDKLQPKIRDLMSRRSELKG